MALYKGFSFKNWQKTKSFKITDVSVVKQDLMNQLYTQRGERVHLRTFGTDIERLLFAPFDERTVTAIANQVRAVID